MSLKRNLHNSLLIDDFQTGFLVSVTIITVIFTITSIMTGTIMINIFAFIYQKIIFTKKLGLHNE